MNPALLGKYKKYNLDLSKDSWTNYLRVLRRLCQDYEHVEFVPTIRSLVRGKKWKELYMFADSLSEQMYPDATQHFVANQFSALIRKYPFPKDLDLGLDPEGTAKTKFLKSERRCLLVNKRFRLYDSCRSPFEDSLARARGWIAYVLGDFNLDSMYENCWFGPGANLGIHGNAVSFARKILSDAYTCTPGAALYGRSAFMRHSQLFEDLLLDDSKSGVYCADDSIAKDRYSSRLRIVQHNKISFVPKNAKTHRAIAIEPLINGFLQKGADIVMRRRLLRVGIDLRNQSVNQNLAKLGSLDDTDEGFVTIDLSSASDSISYEVVRNLLPPEWFAYLNAIRSEHYELDGILRPFHKFCSMGNGFCFPLESLLFAAACHATGCGKSGVDFVTYGDDIIIRKRHAAKLIEFLRVLGFSVNKDKTFLSGPFRESCGADWYSGKDVRPMTLDFALDSIQALFKFSNLTLRNDRNSAFFSSVRPLLRSLAPPEFCFVRPSKGPDDTAFQVELDEFLASPHARWSKDYQSWEWRELLSKATVDPLPQRHSRYHSVLVMAALSGSSPSAPFTMRRMPRTKVRFTSYSGANAMFA